MSHMNLDFREGTSFYETDEYGPRLRWQALERCGNPLCECVVRPTFIVFAGVEDRWLACFVSNDPHAAAERCFDSDAYVERVEALALLIGVDWERHVVRAPSAVMAHQTEAIRMLPTSYINLSVDEAARVSEPLVADIDPRATAELLRHTDLWASWVN